MAGTKCYSVTSSNFLLKVSGNEDECVCERCRERESQLKEAMDELNSAQTIINILQKELLLFKASTTTCADDQFPTEGPCSKPNAEVWTLAASNNNIVKSQKRDKRVRGEFASSGNYVSTANRFSPHSNLEGELAEHRGTQKSSERASTQRIHKTTNHQSKGNKIPTIVNGILDSYREFPSSTYNKEETSNVKRHQACLLLHKSTKTLCIPRHP